MSKHWTEEGPTYTITPPRIKVDPVFPDEVFVHLGVRRGTGVQEVFGKIPTAVVVDAVLNSDAARAILFERLADRIPKTGEPS